MAVLRKMNCTTTWPVPKPAPAEVVWCAVGALRLNNTEVNHPRLDGIPRLGNASHQSADGFDTISDEGPLMECGTIGFRASKAQMCVRSWAVGAGVDAGGIGQRHHLAIHGCASADDPGDNQTRPLIRVQARLAGFRPVHHDAFGQCDWRSPQP